MEFLEKEIELKGQVLEGDVLKVGSFLNHNMDVKLITKIGRKIANHFKDKKVTKVITVEASGIAFALAVAQALKVDMVFAKKTQALNADGQMLQAECKSYTRKGVNIIAIPKEYLDKNERVLIVDDFLAHGNATEALRELVRQAGATLVGVGIAVEKGFQGGGDKMRKEGIDLLSCAVVDKMEKGKIIFRKQVRKK